MAMARGYSRVCKLAWIFVYRLALLYLPLPFGTVGLRG